MKHKFELTIRARAFQLTVRCSFEVSVQIVCVLTFDGPMMPCWCHSRCRWAMRTKCWHSQLDLRPELASASRQFGRVDCAAADDWLQTGFVAAADAFERRVSSSLYKRRCVASWSSCHPCCYCFDVIDLCNWSLLQCCWASHWNFDSAKEKWEREGWWDTRDHKLAWCNSVNSPLLRFSGGSWGQRP